jgi:hypothetical protein
MVQHRRFLRLSIRDGLAYRQRDPVVEFCLAYATSDKLGPRVIVGGHDVQEFLQMDLRRDGRA